MVTANCWNGPISRPWKPIVASQDLNLAEADRQAVEKLEKMSLAERRRFWQEELSRCFKCYACRAACPLCYCGRCTVECNQPQWIRVPAHDLGNLEWHMYAGHAPGRPLRRLRRVRPRLPRRASPSTC